MAAGKCLSVPMLVSDPKVFYRGRLRSHNLMRPQRHLLSTVEEQQGLKAAAAEAEQTDEWTITSPYMARETVAALSEDVAMGAASIPPLERRTEQN